MGVIDFFPSLTKNENINKKEKGIIIGLDKSIETDFSYIDFNSIAYTCVNEIEKEINYILYSIILNQFGSQFCDKTREYAIKWNYDLENANLLSYKNHFRSELIDKVALDKIKQNVLYINTKLCNPERMRLVFLALDGVPQMAKEVEQKKRRFNGYVISKLKNKIYEKFSGTLSPMRRLFEENKISFDRGKIISWTPFMKSIQEFLISDEFHNEMKLSCPKLEQIIVSHQNVCGEGEKKIMEHILENKMCGNYTIFSPDGDTIILGIIIQNQLNNNSKVTILRHNQQTKEYDSVDIDTICNNIFEYVKKLYGPDIITSHITKNTVTNDVAFLFTLFGNDFISKVESIDVRNDINTILDIYCNVIKRSQKSQKKCLIYTSSNGLQRINYFTFADFIKEVANIEGTILNETYLTHKYKNYNFYKRELGVSRLLPILEQYVPTANSIFEMLRTAKESNNNDIIEKIVSQYSGDLTFMERFLVFEGNGNKKIEVLSSEEIIGKFRSLLQKNLTFSIENNKDIRGRLYFQKYDSFDINNLYHKKNIVDSFAHPLMEICELDIEYYKLDKKLGEYETKLNAGELELGTVRFITDEKGNYVIKYYSRQDAIKKYYKTYFNIDAEIKLYNPDPSSSPKKVLSFDKSITSLVEDYIKGLFWVFDNYFNKNNSRYNANYVSTWIYPYHRSPLMYQMKEVLFKFATSKDFDFVIKMNSLYNDVTINPIYIHERHLFMNKIEHYIYVTPSKKLENLPERYVKFIGDNKDFFCDLDMIAEKIWTSEDNSDVIDCKRISFLNKCNLLTVKFVKFEDYMNKILSLREQNEIQELVYPFIKVF